MSKGGVLMKSEKLEDVTPIQISNEYKEAVKIFPALHKYQNEHTVHNLQNLCVEIADFCKSVYASTQSENERKIFHSVLDKIQDL